MEQTTPLTRTFKFWFQNYQKSDESDFAHSLLPIATVNSLEQFWAYYQHLRRPSHIEEHHNLYLFQDGITPLWQDPANKPGGALVLYFQKAKCDKIWEDLVLSYISHETEDAKAINGLRLKIRKDVATIEVWVSVQQNDKPRWDNIRKWFVEAAGLKDDTHVDFMSFY